MWQTTWYMSEKNTSSIPPSTPVFTSHAFQETWVSPVYPGVFGGSFFLTAIFDRKTPLIRGQVYLIYDKISSCSRQCFTKTCIICFSISFTFINWKEVHQCRTKMGSSWKHIFRFKCKPPGMWVYKIWVCMQTLYWSCDNPCEQCLWRLPLDFGNYFEVSEKTILLGNLCFST